MKDRLQRWLRFGVGGALNTAVSYGLYLALALLFNYQLAYLLAYALGVLFAYWFNSVFVFRTPLSWSSLFAYPLVYVLQYGLSAGLLALLVEYAGIGARPAPLLVAAAMVPFSYLINKAVLAWSAARRASALPPSKQ